MEAAHITWRPLGQLFVERGLITQEELEGALVEQRETSKRLGTILVSRGLVSGPELTSVLVDQLGMELTKESGFGSGLWDEIRRRHPRGRDRVAAEQAEPRRTRRLPPTSSLRLSPRPRRSRRSSPFRSRLQTMFASPTRPDSRPTSPRSAPRSRSRSPRSGPSSRRRWPRNEARSWPRSRRSEWPGSRPCRSSSRRAPTGRLEPRSSRSEWRRWKRLSPRSRSRAGPRTTS